MNILFNIIFTARFARDTKPAAETKNTVVDYLLCLTEQDSLTTFF